MNWCHGVCGGNGQWTCSECEIWSSTHADDTARNYHGCASAACIAKHDSEMRGHPAHRWKELARTDHDEYLRQAFGRGGPQKPEHERRAEDETMLRAWCASRDARRVAAGRSGGSAP